MKIAHAALAFLVAALLSCTAWGQLVVPDGYQQVYSLDINKFVGGQAAPYTVDNSSQNFGLLESVGYHYQLDTTEQKNWVWVSMGAFTNDPTKVGVPTVQSEAFFQRYVSNLEYQWNAPSFSLNGVASGSATAARGNIEFWPVNYGRGNALGIAGAAANAYDHDDAHNAGTHGSMQIHAHTPTTTSATPPATTTTQTVFAFNRWGGTVTNGPFDVGIGKRSAPDTDWTNAANSNAYTTKQLDVYVKSLDFKTAAREFILNETAGGMIAYKYNIPKTGTMSTNDVLIDNTSTMHLPVERVAYYIEATRADESGVEYIYTSMDGLTVNPKQTGIPMDGSFIHQKAVENLTVRSNVAGVSELTNSPNGNVEIWRGQYGNTKSTTNTINNPDITAGSGNFDYNDYRNPSTAVYGSFQVHDHVKGETFFAINRWAQTGATEFGIGNNPTSGGQPDWTFDSNNGASSNINNYSDIKMYAIATPAYAPGMKNVANAGDYTTVQAMHITAAENNYLNNSGTSYFIDNTAQMQADGVMFDRVGYYMEYINPTKPNDVYYAFVSMDAFQLSGNSQVTGIAAGDWMQDITKIGVPDSKTRAAFQQYVKNLEITTNVPSTEGKLTLGEDGKTTNGQRTGTAKKGFLEFWAASYGAGANSKFPHGSGTIFDTNDSYNGTNPLVAGHGSMQVHNIDTGETVVALNNFNATKQFGIGTNPNASTNTSGGQADWTHYNTKASYTVANMYMYVRESSAVMATFDAESGYSMYQRSVGGSATVDISGNYIVKDGMEISRMQYSVDDGQTWMNMTDLTLNDGTFSANAVLGTGWHDITIRALDAGGHWMSDTKLADKVGVGEIFITAGQSNSANHGEAAQKTTTGNVIALAKSGQWQIADDPQPWATTKNGGGSTWPAFGEKLSAMLSADEGRAVPVGIVSVGVGDTQISQWDPKSSPTNYDRLESAIQLLKGMGTEFAGVLWHQGENDTSAGTSQADYEAALGRLIEASRAEADFDYPNMTVDWELPWLVALVSYRPGTGEDEDIRNAQLAVINDMSYVFEGPDSDLLTSGFRAAGDGIHFNANGLQTLGDWWAGAAYDMIQTRGSYATPEPATWVMLLLGVVGIIVWRRRAS